MTAILCALALQGTTMAYMDGQPNVLVRRCTYKCRDNSETTHQIYEEDYCPRVIPKGTRSLYYYIK